MISQQLILKNEKQPIKVCVTGAAGNIGYALIFQIASGVTFGNDQPVILHLLDLPDFLSKTEAVKMELIDCAFPLVRGVNCYSDPNEAFRDLDYAALVGAKPRGPGMERKDLLVANSKIFVSQGQALNNAKPSCKVVVIGNPCNTNCLIASKNCTTIPKENFSCLTMLDHLRATGIICDKLNIHNTDLVNGIFVLGNHSATQVPIIDFATVDHNVNNTTQTLSLKSLLNDDKYITDKFINQIQTRGAAVIKARGASSAASAAFAVSRHLGVLHNGSNGRIVSLGVYSTGEYYGFGKDVYTSLPVTVEKGGNYTVVDGFVLNDFYKGLVKKTNDELEQERSQVL